MLKKIGIILVGCFMIFTGYSQQLPLYSQYMMNGFILNSAMAGSDGMTSFNLTTRQQWLGMTNAPLTFSIAVQTRILKRSYIIKTRPLRENKFIPARSGKIGLGIHVFNDRNGDFTQTGMTMAYSYHIPFPNAQLSFGLSATLSQLKVDVTENDFRVKYDKVIALTREPFYIGDGNAGVFFSNRVMYAGISIENLFESSFKLGNTILDSYKQKRHYFILGGYRFSPKINIIYEPSFLIKTTEQFFPQLDLSLKVYYYENYWMGFSYRTGNFLIFFLGVKKNFISAGYAFDYGFNSFQRNSFGSHELILSLKFGDSARRYKWLNRY